MKFIVKMKTHFLFRNVFQKNYAVYVEECGRTREDTNDSAIWCMRVAFWISTATRARAHTHREMRILLFYGNSGYVHAPRYYVIRIACLVNFWISLFLKKFVDLKSRVLRSTNFNWCMSVKVNIVRQRFVSPLNIKLCRFQSSDFWSETWGTYSSA